MPVFVPFKALRPKTQHVDEVICKPYDTLNTDEAKEESRDNQNSYYRIIKPEIEFPADKDPFEDEVYKRGVENLEDFINRDILSKDDKSCFYVYRLIMGDHIQSGLVGCCSVGDYYNEKIKKHELTKPHVVEDRTKHITVSGYNYEAVFFTYPKQEEIDEIVERVEEGAPLYDVVTNDGVEHTVWKIDDEKTIQYIADVFATDVPRFYIADGHHRTAAAANAAERFSLPGMNGHIKRKDKFLSVVFPDDQVQILDYNRVVKDLNGLTTEQFLISISEKFRIEPVEGEYRPEKQSELGMYLEGQWYKLEANDNSYDKNDPVQQLGFTILSNMILEPLLGIKDLRKDTRIDFVGGIRGLTELVRRVESGDKRVAFSVHPISISQLIAIADKGLILPPKVTWFEPKLKSGLFAHDLRD